MANFSLGNIGFPIHGNTDAKDQGDKDDPLKGINLHPDFHLPGNSLIPGVDNPHDPQGNHDLPPDEDTGFGNECGQVCPEDATCVFYHTQFQCICGHTLKRPGPDGSCREPTTKVPKVDKGNKFPDHTVAPPKHNNTGGVIDHWGLHEVVKNNKKLMNDTTTSGLLRTKPAPIERHPDWKILQIALPVGFFLFLSIIVGLLLMRRWRHSRSSKRSSDGVVKNSDNVQLLERMNIISKNPTYFTSLHEGVEGKELYVREIPLEQLKLVEVVGEGAFGQVFKGDLFNSETNCGTKVAVKVLKEGVCCEIREDFEREVEIMSAFDHDNILRLIGVVTQNVGESPYMVFEYMEYGDLAELLRKNDPILRKTDDCVVLQKNDLGDIAIQIANGMTYLTSQHFVHRDLATRNCLVGEGLVVKISDFGMSRDIYTCDYYKIGGSRMLPVRWMSPESVKYGRFTSESDVWAYGVVLWEIYSCGRQPYYGHSNEEVIRFLDEKIYLQRPEDCPDAIHNVMTGCWKQEPKERLTFERIQRLLAEYNKKVVLNEIIEKSMDSSSLNEVLA